MAQYHVGPRAVYNFTYGLSHEHCWAGAVNNRYIDGPTGCAKEYNLVARNITYMKLNARTFLRDLEPHAPFFLYVGFGDVHRCREGSAIGAFCENYGAPGWSEGAIPDWTPTRYPSKSVAVPAFLPDTSAVRSDLSGLYTAWSRLDQGVGLLMEEVAAVGAANTTLSIFFSDNGTPFPSGKTNLFTEQVRPAVRPLLACAAMRLKARVP